MTERRIDLVRAFAAALLAIGATGCYCPSPLGNITFVAAPSTGDDAAALAIDCAIACGPSARGCTRKTNADGTPGFDCGLYEAYHDCGPGGRRPTGLDARRRRRPLRSRRAREAAMLAGFAHLEAASVLAFDDLAGHLERYDAPAVLVARARASALDEARHARAMGHLARRAGRRPRPMTTAPHATPSLLGLAIENAVEGCVLETFAALLAHHQAAHARDRRFRLEMKSIAIDETLHAELSHDVDAWVRTQLSAADITILDSAHALAWRRLSRPTTSAALPRLGIPDGSVRAALARALRSALGHERGAVSPSA